MGKFYEGLADELILYARQWAWLSAIPKLKDMAGKETVHPARIEAYRVSGAEPPLPEVTARHLCDWLMEAGPIEAGAMGRAPLSWREIDAWGARTFTRPSAWEARLLRRASSAYLAEMYAAEDSHRAAPWWPERREVDHEANERQLRSVLG